MHLEPIYQFPPQAPQLIDIIVHADSCTHRKVTTMSQQGLGSWRIHMISALTFSALASGCGQSPTTDNNATDTYAPLTASAPQHYDGAAYAAQVEDAILSSFSVRSFPEACPQPDWVCAISRIESPRPGQLEVTLQPDWEAAFGEWTGPPAGIGCPKWGEQLRRNITNFVVAAHVPPPRYINVREPDSRNC